MKTPKLFALAWLLVGLSTTSALAQDDNPIPDPVPLSSSPSAAAYWQQPSFAQQRARFEAEQRMYRMEWNNWINYSPLRPNVNASMFASGYSQHYYIPQRGVMINHGRRGGWYW